MPTRTSKRTTGRRRRSVWVDDTTWERADAMTATQAITVGHILSELLNAYANGVLDVPVPTEGVRAPGRGVHPTAIFDNAWSNADRRRRSEGVQSMSVLCELLLRAYTEGHVHAGITVQPLTTTDAA
ncbi:hypothetical protein DFP74_4729 [Nocardiopsis sp. Huas11]|uniref:hypothetical protein n=1 Tax=Nocardiopsis sp. Huas11 TaxID=2183912 RepID=UPI000F292275|nr:hypothetical protein [Nocardiopsis sp. Huas11]RKS09001.1 hypothetical protein DFP74_4729 [Nocardiopsis sp. Huas11]